MAKEEIERISEITQDERPGKVSTGQQVERVAPNKEHFDSALGMGVSRPDAISPFETKHNLLDEIRNLNRTVEQAHKVTPEKLAEQAKDLIVQIDDLKSKLETSNLDSRHIK